MTVAQFREKYLKYDDTDGPAWRTCQTPCPFLNGTKCSVYEYVTGHERGQAGALGSLVMKSLQEKIKH